MTLYIENDMINFFICTYLKSKKIDFEYIAQYSFLDKNYKIIYIITIKKRLKKEEINYIKSIINR